MTRVRWLGATPSTFGSIWWYLYGWVWNGAEWQVETNRVVRTTSEDALIIIDPFLDKYGKPTGSVVQGPDGKYRTGKIWFYDDQKSAWNDYYPDWWPSEPALASKSAPSAPQVDPSTIPAPRLATSSASSSDSGSIVLGVIAAVAFVGLMIVSAHPGPTA